MIVIDSSSLILLAKASVLEELVKIDKFIISNLVYQESVVEGKERGMEDALLIEKLILENKIEVYKVAANAVKGLEKTFGIREGENETLSIGIGKKSRFVITDDKKSIIVCKIMKIPYMIAIDAVIDLYENKKISHEKALQAFDKIKKHGWLSEDIIKSREKRLKGG